MKNILFLFFCVTHLLLISCNSEKPKENIPVSVVETPDPIVVEEKKDTLTPPSSVTIAQPKVLPVVAQTAPVDPKIEKKATKSGGPKATFEQARFNFGTVTQGEKIAHTFKITNTGGSPLEILDATSSCGCTQPSFNFLPIMPGSSSEVKVVFDTEHKEGNQTATVNVITNANPKEYKVYLEGVVIK